MVAFKSIGDSMTETTYEIHTLKNFKSCCIYVFCYFIRKRVFDSTSWEVSRVVFSRTNIIF